MKVSRSEFWLGLLALVGLNILLGELIQPQSWPAMIAWAVWCLGSGGAYGYHMRIAK